MKNMITFLVLIFSLNSFADNFTYIQGPTLIESTSTTTTSGGNTTLTVNSNTNQEFTGSSNQTVTLPNATSLKNGRKFNFINPSSGIVTIVNNGGVTLQTMTSGSASTFILMSNSTSNGSWDVGPLISSGSFSNPMTTLGDTIYGGASGIPNRLAGNTLTTKQFYTQTGTGSASAAPMWAQILNTDLPNMGAYTTKGNNTGTSATQVDLSINQFNSMTHFSPNFQKFITNATYGISYWFIVSSANATAGATYTNNANTFTVVNTVSAGTKILFTSTGAPSASGTLTKSAGTGDATINFSLVISPIYIHVKMVGGGGGGAGSGSSGAASGAFSADTNFGSGLLIAGGGGGGGVNTVNGGSSGTFTIGAGAIGFGVGGGMGGAVGTTSVSSSPSGGIGGSSCLGGAGSNSGSTNTGAGAGGIASTGGGGGGAGAGLNSTTIFAGSGGGSGGCVDAIINNPSPTYSITVGSGGGGGAAGVGGFSGGSGANGAVYISEYFQ